MVGDDFFLEKAANLVAEKSMFFLKMVRASMAVLLRVGGALDRETVKTRSIKRLLVMLKFTP